MLQAILTDLTIKHYNDEAAECDDGSGSKEYFEAIGIRAEATIFIPFEIYTNKGKDINYKTQDIDTGGLWGISADDRDYHKEVAKEELNTLKDYLQILNVNINGGFELFPSKNEKTLSFDELVLKALEKEPTFCY
jgi:hypothetical protein